MLSKCYLGYSFSKPTTFIRRHYSQKAKRKDFKRVNHFFVSYMQIDENDIKYFQSILAPKNVVTDAFTLDSYNVDWLSKYRGDSKLALLPETTQQGLGYIPDIFLMIFFS